MYTLLSNFKIRHDVTCGRLCASLRVIPKHVRFAVIPYATHAINGKSPQIRNDITSNLEVGKSVVANGTVTMQRVAVLFLQIQE